MSLRFMILFSILLNVLIASNSFANENEIKLFLERYIQNYDNKALVYDQMLGESERVKVSRSDFINKNEIFTRVGAKKYSKYRRITYSNIKVSGNSGSVDIKVVYPDIRTITSHIAAKYFNDGKKFNESDLNPIINKVLLSGQYPTLTANERKDLNKDEGNWKFGNNSTSKRKDAIKNAKLKRHQALEKLKKARCDEGDQFACKAQNSPNLNNEFKTRESKQNIINKTDTLKAKICKNSNHPDCVKWRNRR